MTDSIFARRSENYSELRHWNGSSQATGKKEEYVNTKKGVGQ
jgi:hypothetical protein